MPRDESGAHPVRPDWRAALGIVVVASGVRAVHLLSTGNVPFVHELVGDAAGYYAWAQRIASGDWIGQESFYQAPLYPYVLAVWFKLAGDSVAGIRWLQAAWGTLAALCLWYGTTRLFGRPAGLIAGLMMALYAPAIFFDGIVQKAALAGLLTAALFATMAVGTTPARRRAWPFAAAGVVFGALILTRENALVWAPLMLLWSYAAGDTVVSRRRRIQRVLLSAIGMALLLAPVAVRNRVVGGQWSISTFQSGPNFYIGNHAGASGRYEPLVRGHETPAFERKDATRLAEQGTWRDLTPREVSQYWRRRAWEDIRRDPAAWLKLLGTKLLMTVNDYEVSDAESLYVYAAASPLLAALAAVWDFGVLCPLAAIGIVSTRRQWRRLWVFYAMLATMAAAVAFFYVMARYRFPLAPLLIPFAAAAVPYLWHHLRRRNVRRLLASGAVAGLVATVVHLPLHPEARLNGLAWMNVGVAEAQRGRLPQATRYFRMAVEGHPGSAEAHNNLAMALAVQGRYTAAIPHYEAALRLEPSLPGLHFNLAVALEHVGRTDEALRHYERALSENPADAAAQAAIQRLRRE